MNTQYRPSISSPISQLWKHRHVYTICISVLLLNAISFLPFFTDDALISLQYAKRLIRGDGLTWTAGERVEGYSNLLWVLLTAFVSRLGVDLIEAARGLGVLLSVVSLAAIFLVTNGKKAAIWIGALTFSLYGPVGAWAIGGLEQPLLVALILWASIFSARYLDAPSKASNLWGSGLLLGLATITRSDGILFAVAIAFVVAGSKGRGSSKRAVHAFSKVMVIPVVFLLGQTLFRIGYYGEFVSNIAFLKIAFSIDRLWYGLRYVVRGYALLFPLSLVVFAGIGAYWSKAFPQSNLLRICGAQLLLWSAYLVFIGGDVNPPSRHFVPIAGLTGLLLVAVCSQYIDECADRCVRFPYTFTVLCFFVFFFIQCFDIENSWARRTRGAQSCREVSELMKRQFLAKDPLLAVDSAGCFPYWSELRSVDLLGLNDYTIARTRSDDFGTGWIGHEAGNGDYVFDRKADILAFCGYAGADTACWRSGKEMQADPRFHHQYKLTRLNIANLDSIEARLWIRVSGPLGVLGGEDERIVPVYFLDDNGWPVLVEEADTSFQYTIDPEKSYRLDSSLIGVGKWRISVQGDLGFCVVHREISVPANGEVVLNLEAADAPLFIRRCSSSSDAGNLKLIRFTRAQ